MTSAQATSLRPLAGDSRQVVFGASAVLVALAAATLPAGAARRGPVEQPNVVVVMTDDQTSAAMDAMPLTESLIGDQGATFSNSFASFPLCCPSRATFLTGQYAHNHRVLNNIPPQGGFDTLRGGETLPVWLQRAGYYTGLVGKYLNGYETSRGRGCRPATASGTARRPRTPTTGTTCSRTGGYVRYGDPDEDPTDPAHPETYSSDVYTDKAVDFIDRPRAAAISRTSSGSPTTRRTPARPNPPTGELDRCRGNAKPAARDIGAFEDAPLPTPPSFNEANVVGQARLGPAPAAARRL